MRTYRRRARGGAAVELAVLMFMLVPLVMYTLYLEDLLFYKLDQEETVVSTPWDFVHEDFRHRAKDSIVYEAGHTAALTYCDHTSAWNTYDNADSDCKDAKHHQALAAHQCWLASGGKQMSCEWDSSVGDGHEFNQTFTNYGGNLVRCSARLGVQNYFLPEQFLGRLVAYSKRYTAASGSSVIHDNATNDTFVFPEEVSAMVHDSYALNHLKRGREKPTAGAAFTPQSGDDVSVLDPARHPDASKSEWTQWVQAAYEANGNGQAAQSFGDGLAAGKFLGSEALDDTTGDNVTTVPLGYSTDYTEKFSRCVSSSKCFNPSGYRDERLQRTRRTNLYMGMPQDTW